MAPVLTVAPAIKSGTMPKQPLPLLMAAALGVAVDAMKDGSMPAEARTLVSAVCPDLDAGELDALLDAARGVVAGKPVKPIKSRR